MGASRRGTGLTDQAQTRDIFRYKPGEAFRYAARRDGGPILLREQEIDLVRLCDVMEGFAIRLGGVDGALEAAGWEGSW